MAVPVLRELLKIRHSTFQTKTKSLLLTKKFDLDKLNSSPTTSGSIVNSIKRNRDLAEERKRVIESYRAMKRSKHEL